MAQISVTTTVYANQLQLIDREAMFCGCVGYNSGADQFIQVHDSASLPSNGAVPKVMFKALSGENFSLDFGRNFRNFINGIIIVNSTTAETLTIGAADCWIDAQYI